jgi:hypothetical protein
MNHLRSQTRREFTVESLTAMFAGVLVTVSACNDAPTAPGSGDRLGGVGANHGHVARVTAVQLNDGNAVVLDIRGSADHPHSVELSAGEVVQIRDGLRVTKSSSSNSSPTTFAHDHTVTFN